MKKLSVASILLLVVCGSLFAKNKLFKPWFNMKGSYQLVWHTDMKSSESSSAFELDRARVGMEGMFIQDLYFKVTVEAKNTKKGKGTELKAAFLSWEFTKNQWLEAGGLTTAFSRPLSGTEFAFINYDITDTPNAYQYGISYKGVFFDGLLTSYLSITDGEGFNSINVGDGYLYLARFEFLLMGKKQETDGNVKKYPFPSLQISIAAGLDNKAETVDNGVTYEYFSSRHFLIDAYFKMGGLSVFGQYVDNKFNSKKDGSYWGGAYADLEASRGGFIQVGYNLGTILPIDLEPMIKIEDWKDIQNEGAGSVTLKKRHFVFGVNLYVREHYMKINAEYRRVLTDDRSYLVSQPADNFFGIRITHKFTTKFDTK